MRPSRLSTGARAGVVAWAATTGAVLGFGLRHGSATRPFADAGGYVLAAVANVTGITGTAGALFGIALHLAWSMVLGVCFTFVAGALRGPRLVLAAVAFALLLWALLTRVVPATQPATGVLSLSAPQLLLLHLLLAVGLALGMRVAQLSYRVR